ncbi:MAG: hypothetical protein ABFS34_07905 [Gemmatimonadota bacterium]
MTAIAKLRTISSGAAVCLAALTANACGDGDPAGPDAAPHDEAGQVVATSHVPGPLPFMGTVRATEQVPGAPTDDCDLVLHTVLEGELTHLGSFTGVGETCGFNVRPNEEELPEEFPDDPGIGPPLYLVIDFTLVQTYTAADGDVLEVSGVGVRAQGQFGAALVGNGIVEGGTGRFAGATGEFDVFGVNGEVGYDGWIDYDASS